MDDNDQVNFVFISMLVTKAGTPFQNLIYIDGDLEDLYERIQYDELIPLQSAMNGSIVEVRGDNIDYIMRPNEYDVSCAMDFAASEDFEKPQPKTETPAAPTDPNAQGGKVIDFAKARRNKDKNKKD